MELSKLRVGSSTMEMQRISISSLCVKLLSVALKALKYLQDQMTENQDWARNG